MKINKPAILIPEEKWYDEFSNCDDDNVYEITYEDFDSGKIVKNKVTQIGIDGNDKKDDWWLNCSILGYENEEEWQEENHPQIFKFNIDKVIKIK